MIKLVGICFLMVACTGGGFVLSSGLSARVRILEALRSLLEDFSVSIRFKRETVLGLIESACVSAANERLGFLAGVKSRFKACRNFPAAWRESVVEWAPNCLKEEDKALILDIGNFLGGSDVDGQLASISLKQEEALKLLKEAEEERTKKSKLFRSLGVLGGAFAAILLL